MNKGFVFGATAAIGALMLVPGVAFALSRAGRPVARAAIRTGAVAYNEFQKAGAEVFEHMEDLAAEFEAELKKARADDRNEDGGATEVKTGTEDV